MAALLARLGWSDAPWSVLLALLAALSVVGGVTLSALARFLMARVAARTPVEWDDRLVARVRLPLTIGCALAVAALLLPWTGLGPEAAATAERVLRGTFFVVLLWVLLRAIDVASSALSGSRWVAERPSSRALVPLGSRVGKVVIGVLAIVALLSSLGFSVASLLAGLGIGGLAVALGAQKTLENLFGAFALGLDQPLREGDFVKVEDFVGTVERIGLRSTRIRTLDRTVISMPNGKLADMKVETFAARDRIRLALELPLAPDVKAAQLRRIADDVRAALLGRDKVVQPGVTVALKTVARGVVTVEVGAWFATVDGDEFSGIRHDLLLQFLEIVERAGARVAA